MQNNPMTLSPSTSVNTATQIEIDAVYENKDANNEYNKKCPTCAFDNHKDATECCMCFHPFEAAKDTVMDSSVNEKSDINSNAENDINSITPSPSDKRKSCFKVCTISQNTHKWNIACINNIIIIFTTKYFSP